ncbi:MAG TPA: hypothetical protein VF035_06480 [Longimicrobiales bacterium]
MDGLNDSFGLTLGNGLAGSDLALSDFLRALRVAGGDASDAAVIARRLEAEPDFGTRPFARLVEELSGPADRNAPLVSEVVRSYGADALQRLLLRLDEAERRRLAARGSKALSPAALIPLLQATAGALSIVLSQPLLELTQKLAAAAQTTDAAVRDRAADAFRGLSLHLVERWSVKESLTKSSIAPEPSRVLALSLETGAVGTVVWSAFREQSLTEPGVRTLVEMVTQAEDSAAKRALTARLATPARLAALLREGEIDFAAVDLMIAHLDREAVGPLLDALVNAQGRGTRRALMDRLVRLGPDIASQVLNRLGDARWFVVRNMISLLRETEADVPASALDPFVTHNDARVRREVLQLRMEREDTRAAALTAAVRDHDKSVLRTALQTARGGLPAAAVAILAQRVAEPDFPPEFRVMSLYLLGRTRDPAARTALLSFAGGGRSLFGKAKLAPKSPEMLAALSGLARSWPTDPHARDLLDVAAKSKDDQILNALRAVGTDDGRGDGGVRGPG